MDENRRQLLIRRLVRRRSLLRLSLPCVQSAVQRGSDRNLSHRWLASGTPRDGHQRGSIVLSCSRRTVDACRGRRRGELQV